MRGGGGVRTIGGFGIVFIKFMLWFGLKNYPGNQYIPAISL
jgi:hypothetical protein